MNKEDISKDAAVVWTLPEALVAFRMFQTIAHAHKSALAMGGSVINKGQSCKDLDIVVHPMNGKEIVDPAEMVKALRAIGVTDWEDCSKYGAKNTDSDRMVCKSLFQGKRIDWFFFVGFPSSLD